ncbi:type I polyketide synthase [Paenibacillus sp. SYP-B4298]|uniref:type I polyketide synthase n=1 Tax=Paenibacillus sp. SYP-B4298 TaxID=2996034 RepID=UPI0022DD71FF|nr:beta-ketoacyl synthase N-terminal-like domain-containing protein [Paenibacillus sp. SYP-B4298]
MNTINESIAIVGMNCRFPGAEHVEEFWMNLSGSKESVRSFTDEELLGAGIDSALLNKPGYVKAGAVLNHIDAFDAGFFGLTPKEAEIMDPQHRIFLELVWETLELSGTVPDTFNGRIGVYAGAFLSTYMLQLFDNPQLAETVGEMSLRHGNDKDYLATRASYKLNLTGPSVTLQTSCSTSLVAIHLAVQSLLSGECDLALAGGVSIGSQQIAGYMYQEGGILSPDGKCRPFDAAASGTIFGNGAGVVALKRLEEAEADGNTIYAVIKGSAINNDGSDKVGYTAPSVTGQSQVIVDALAVAEIDPSTIRMVEAHGTGTPLGDPIEIAALTQAYRAMSGGSLSDSNYCAIGSVKSNIGHLGAASGVAGFIKAVLSLYHRQIPASLHFHTPNPNIPFTDSPFYVNTQHRDWPADRQHPRRAAVSSFGMGGTNAHVVLEEYAAPACEPVSAVTARRERLFVLSAKTGSALEEMERRLASYVQSRPEVCLDSVAYTLQEGRKAFAHRSFFIADSADALAEQASSASRATYQRGVAAPAPPRIAFVFPGQGTQYVGMAKELYASEAAFREAFDQCCRLLRPLIGADLQELLWASDSSHDAASAELQQTALAQPAIFAVEYSLARLLQAWGIWPDVMIGHSIGEYVAACIAEVFTLEEALRLVTTRGKLMQSMPAGAMLSVALAEEELERYLGEALSPLSLAAVNAPGMCVLAGAKEQIQHAKAQLDTHRIENRLLVTSHAFHSEMMDPIIEPFIKEVEAITKRAPQIPYISNVTGALIEPEQAVSARYWGEQLRSTVRFMSGVQALADEHTVWLEVGPGQSLTSLIKRCSGMDESLLIGSVLRHPKDRQSDRRIWLQAIGRLYLKGVAIRWPSHAMANRQRLTRLPLPTYPFERKSYWVTPGHRAVAAPLPSAPATGGDAVRPIRELFHSPVWRLTRPLSPAVQISKGVLVLGDAVEESGELAHLLLQGLRSRLPVVVHAAAADARSALQHYRDETGETPEAIIFLADGSYSASIVGELVRELLLEEHAAAPLVRVVTSGAVAISHQEEEREERAQFIAAIRDMAELTPHCGLNRLDIAVISGHGARRTAMIDRWIDELLRQEIAESDAAYRGMHRYVLEMEAHPLPLSVSPGSSATISATSSVAVSVARPGTVIFGSQPDEWNKSVMAELSNHGLRHFTFISQPGRDYALWLAEDPFLADKLVSQEWTIAIETVEVGNGEIPIAKALQSVSQEVRGIILGFGAASDTCRQLESIRPWLADNTPEFVLCLSDQSAQDDSSLSRSLWEDRLIRAGRALSRTTGNLVLNIVADRKIRSQEDISASIGMVLERPLPHIILAAQAVDGQAEPQEMPEELSMGSVVKTDGRSTEEQVAIIWRELFGIETIQPDDDFFELGGHSLLAIQLVSRIREHFSIELDIESMFDEPTVSGVTKQVQAALGSGEADGQDELEELLRGLDASSLDDLERELDQLYQQNERNEQNERKTS